MSENKPIHVCVGFYPNGEMRINRVRDEDLENNVAYNRANRPGRLYFVDGKYVCGGLLKQPAMDEFIAKCEARLAATNIPTPTTDSRPYV